MASRSSLATIEEEETSPTIRRILQATGCSSRQEFLAMKAAQASQQVNANGSTSTTNPSKDPATNGSKSTHRSKAPNRSKVSNGSKASKDTKALTNTNGSKSTTNPKKKAKSKCCNDTLETP